LHKPVLLKEVIEYLRPRNGDTILDATIGCGGHTSAILEKILPDGMLIGLDRDEEAVKSAGERLSAYGRERIKIVKGNFQDIESILLRIGKAKVNGILVDLGISSYQLDSPYRGFGLMHDGPLDMRMDKSQALTAYEVVNRYSKDKLADIIYKYGEERYSRRIAGHIVEKRRSKAIKTTAELRDIVKKAAGFKYKRQRIDPATRTFQALRIEVNKELEALNRLLGSLPKILMPDARVLIISFHSLEDRQVKNAFKGYDKEGYLRVITKKPIRPSVDEIMLNRRARSAKLRVAEYYER